MIAHVEGNFKAFGRRHSLRERRPRVSATKALEVDPSFL
jgi:hypothetical protein